MRFWRYCGQVNGCGVPPWVVFLVLSVFVAVVIFVFVLPVDEWALGVSAGLVAGVVIFGAALILVYAPAWWWTIPAGLLVAVVGSVALALEIWRKRAFG